MEIVILFRSFRIFTWNHLYISKKKSKRKPKEELILMKKKAKKVKEQFDKELMNCSYDDVIKRGDN